MIKRHLWLVYFTLFLSLIMALMPLPQKLHAMRPEWVLLVLMYWTLALPHRINIGTAWVTGLLMDLAIGSTLGVHAMSYAVSIHITVSNYQKIRNFYLWQQAILVALILALHHLLQFWLSHFLNDVYFSPQYLWPVLPAAAFWPLVFLLLRKYRRHFRIR